MNCTINPIYHQFFAPSRPSLSWETFKSSPEELVRLGKSDFSIDERTWSKTAENVALCVLKIVLFPWAIYECVRYVVQRLLMIAIYPAQSTIMKAFIPELRTSSLDLVRQSAGKTLNSMGYIVRHVALEKDGVRYSGMMIGHKSQIRNGRWALQATGNFAPVEYFAEKAAVYCKEEGFNLLLVNGPGVGRSGGVGWAGTATLKTIGDAQDVAFDFLETALKAKKIVAAGHSLGGAALAVAAETHDFKKGIDYHFISQQSYDTVTNVFREMFSKDSILQRFAGLIHWAGCDNDAVHAARRLSELGIGHTVINSGQGVFWPEYAHDGVIPGRASLGHRLKRDGVIKNKTFMYSPVSHDYPAVDTIYALRKWDAPITTAISTIFKFPLYLAGWYS